MSKKQDITIEEYKELKDELQTVNDKVIKHQAKVDLYKKDLQEIFKKYGVSNIQGLEVKLDKVIKKTEKLYDNAQEYVDKTSILLEKADSVISN